METTDVIEGAALDAYLPQHGAMRLLDRLLTVDDEGAVAEVEVPADGLFVQDGGVGAWVGIEYMAQTVAAWAGARARRAGAPPRIGYLLGCRRYEAHGARFAAGARLRIEVRCELIGSNGLGQFDCRITTAQGMLAAHALLSVFEPPGDAFPETDAPGLAAPPTRAGA